MAFHIRPMLIFFAITVFTLAVIGNMDPCPCRTGYSKIGCYYDPGSHGNNRLRPFPKLLLNLRHQLASIKIWTEGWNEYLREMACRCAALTKQKGYKYFGLQFYGECWSGPANLSTLLHLTPSKRCWGYRPNYQNCVDESPTECIGEANHNYIYKVLAEVPEGCIGGGSGATTPPTTTPSTTTSPTTPSTTAKVATTEEPILLDPCLSRPCQHGGECLNIEQSTDYLCECPSNFVGRNCQIQIG